MLIARYETDGRTVHGILEGDTLRRLAGSPFDGLDPGGTTDALASVRLLAPVEAPRIFGVGLNYVAHIAEAGAPTPAIPLIFMKPSTTAIGPGAPIVYPARGGRCISRRSSPWSSGAPAAASRRRARWTTSSATPVRTTSASG